MRQFHIFHSTEAGKRFEEIDVQPRIYAGFVNAKSVEDAFKLAQNDCNEWADNNQRSTSVGDVIQDDDKFFMVLGIGFKELIQPEDNREPAEPCYE